MTRLLDKTWTTEDEEYNPSRRISEQVEEELEKTVVDTYNRHYVVRITVDKVDQ